MKGSLSWKAQRRTESQWNAMRCAEWLDRLIQERSRYVPLCKAAGVPCSPSPAPDVPMGCTRVVMNRIVMPSEV